MKHFSAFFLLFISLCAITLWLGCSTTKRLRTNEVLLKKVIIKCKNPQVSKEDIYGYLKQKPNRKLFGLNVPHLLKRGKVGKKDLLTNGAGYPFYLHINNLISPKRDSVRRVRRDARFKSKDLYWTNHQTTKRGKPRREPKRRRTLGEFFADIGEQPVVIDDLKTYRSVHQIGLYLDNKGYFNSTVKDTLIYPWLQRKKKRKGILVFTIIPAQPYTIRNIIWEIKDDGIAYDLQTDTTADKVLLKRGANFDVDVFEQERDRITLALRNNGYFLFSKDYVRFGVDTALGSHQVDVTIRINKLQNTLPDGTVIESNHQRYFVRNIVIKSLTNLQQLRDDQTVYDTTVFKEMFFLRNTSDTNGIAIEKKLRFKPEILFSRITFRPVPVYRQSDYDVTYRQLTGLRVFKQVVIDPVIVGGTDKIDVIIKLFPVPKQSFITQVEGTTNSGSNLGIGGSFGYQNNNIFRGAEIFQFNVKGGTEVQKTITGTSNTTGNGFTPNTIQFGADASLNIPREFFPFNLLVRKNRPDELRTTQDRRTVFIASFNYQQRTDYDRSLANLSYGYTFRYKQYSRFSFFPIELNVVKVTPKQGLLDLLQNPDPLLHYRFSNHLIRDFRLTYVYNTQDLKNKKNVYFLKVDGETSGLLLVPEFKYILHATKDAQGSYEIAGIPFSQYVRFFIDFRYYRSIGDHERLVIRVAHGIGFPMQNYPTLPLEKGFYGGGANGIRAWEARSLGPGSYVIPADQKYAQFGDIQAEYNVELRFRISKTLNGAVFADGGNVWLLKDDSLRENENFKFDRFLNDFAFGPGVGLRYDLSFFIIRLDLAFKLRDPGQVYGNRWWVGQRTLGSNLNFGIGYPF